MIPAELAKELVNEQYYQPLTLHLNINNNSKQMWEYAKRCALIAVQVAQDSCLDMYNDIYKHGPYFNETRYAKRIEELKQEIEKL